MAKPNLALPSRSSRGLPRRVRRAPVGLLAAVCLVCLWGALPGGVVSQRDGSGGAIAPAPQPGEFRAPLAFASRLYLPFVLQGFSPRRLDQVYHYGIQAGLLETSDQRRALQAAETVRMGWVKQQVEWKRYNPAPGEYDWRDLDRVVGACQDASFFVLFSVVKAPAWARPSGDTDDGPPADPQTYGAFLRELATRYRGRVAAYEIWNEQNLAGEWGGRGHKLNASRYVELLRVAHDALQAADPQAIVVSGGLAPTGVNDGDAAIDDYAYLEQMYWAGFAPYCDAVGAHPSGYNNPPDAEWQWWSDPSAPEYKHHRSFFFRSTMESYHNLMLQHGDFAKRIWPTEFGWASVENTGVGPAPGYEYAADNSEAEQAQFIVRAYAMGKGWGWVGPMFLWNLNYAPLAGQADEKAAFGIVYADWRPRPAYEALRVWPRE